jgi:hypothetical protein
MKTVRFLLAAELEMLDAAHYYELSMSYFPTLRIAPKITGN